MLLLFVVFQIFVGTVKGKDATNLYALTIVRNLDSLENEIKNCNKLDESNYLTSLFSLEYSRFFFSSNKYGDNLNDIKKLVEKAGNVQLVPYYNLFLAIDKFNHKSGLDSVLVLLNSCSPFFENKKDTLALILTYSRLIDLQMIYRDKDISGSNSQIDIYYAKCGLLSTMSKNNYALLYYYFISIRYYFYYKYDYVRVFDCCNMALQLINNSRNTNFISAMPYFYYYKGVCYNQYYYQPDSAIVYLKKTINANLYAQKNNSVVYDYFYLIKLLKNKQQIDSALAYLKIVEQKICKRNSLNDWTTFYSYKSNLAWAQKKYDTAWLYRNKSDSVAEALENSHNRLPMKKLNEEYKIENLKLRNENVEKQNLISKILILFTFFSLVAVLMFAVFIKRKNSRLLELISFKTQISAIISHDLRSPLFALQGLYQQASFLIKYNRHQELKTLSNHIDMASSNMANLLKNLLVWREAYDKNIEKNIVAINIHSKINDTIDLYKYIIKNQSVIVKNNIDHTITVNGDANILDLLVRNWLDNVLKYASPTTVNLVALQTNAQTTISIIDNGKIDKNAMMKIKEQFLSDEVAIVSQTSSGLGLGLMKGFAKKAGWMLNFKGGFEENEFSIVIPN